MPVIHRFSALCIISLLALGCPDDPDDTLKEETGVDLVDADGDGYLSNEDCDDTNADVYPGADEVCDDTDNDCDGETDEDVTTVFYADEDGDGYGDAENIVYDCDAPAGYTDDDTDCDDGDEAQYPGADEYCNGEDDDCDEEIDEDDAVDGTTWYADGDSDGYGVEDDTYSACTMPSGYSAESTDCDDEDAMQYPGADEYCNGEDDDCDGDVDEDTVDAETSWFADTDGDGYGNSNDEIIQCTQPSGYVLDYTDCDDRDSSIYPGSVEYCDGVDNDCDGDVDEDDAVDGVIWFADSDGDGFGDFATSTYACYQPTGYVLDNTD